MASDEPTGGNIQHTALAKHNTGTVPSAMVVDADGAVVANAGSAMVIDADGTPVVDSSNGHGPAILLLWACIELRPIGRRRWRPL